MSRQHRQTGVHCVVIDKIFPVRYLLVLWNWRSFVDWLRLAKSNWLFGESKWTVFSIKRICSLVKRANKPQTLSDVNDNDKLFNNLVRTYFTKYLTLNNWKWHALFYFFRYLLNKTLQMSIKRKWKLTGWCDVAPRHWSPQYNLW